jgi:hypothetical protein
MIPCSTINDVSGCGCGCGWLGVVIYNSWEDLAEAMTSLAACTNCISDCRDT